MSAREMFEKLGYSGDISWRSALYSKFNKDNNGETKIDIDLEIPQYTTITKTVSNEFWEEGHNEPFTIEEIIGATIIVAISSSGVKLVENGRLKFC